MSYVQEAPYAVQVEFTEGCNLRCDFCAVQGIQEKQGTGYHFMTEDTAYSISAQIADLGWNSRIEFAMHGEPTLHPSAEILIAIFRAQLPRHQLMMTSNGGGLLPDPVKKLNRFFDAGLNVFAFDAYESVNIHFKVHDALSVPSQMGFEWGWYPDNKEMSPHTRRPYGTRLFIWVRDISKATEGTHSNLTNQGGSAAPPDESMEGKRCAKPFRELSIRWDGNVAICCDDWRGVYQCGNITKTPMKEVWNGRAFDAARSYLYRGLRSYLRPCAGCNVRSYRVGLLPDKFGKVMLDEPTQENADAASSAMSSEPYAAPVLREWELVQLGKP